jgi:hypothetical protein
MSDLSQLMQLSPSVAGRMIGTNQRDNELMNNLRQRELADLISQRASEAEFNQQMNPLKLEQQGLQNQTTKAQLPGVEATSRSNVLKADREAATQQTSIDATNAENQDKKSKIDFDQFKRAQDVFMHAGAQLNNVPTPMRGAAFRAMIEQAGMNINSPNVQRMLQMVESNPEQFPQMIMQLSQRLGQQLTNMNPAAQAAIRGHELDYSAKIDSNKRVESASRYRTDTEAKTEAAKNEAGSIETAILNGKVAPERAVIAADLKARSAKTPEEKQFWEERRDSWERYVYNRAQARNEGDVDMDTQYQPRERQLPPAFNGKKPQRGTGTKEDPIVLD